MIARTHRGQAPKRRQIREVANGTADGGTPRLVLTPDGVHGLARYRDPPARFARDLDHVSRVRTTSGVVANAHPGATHPQGTTLLSSVALSIGQALVRDCRDLRRTSWRRKETHEVGRWSNRGGRGDCRRRRSCPQQEEPEGAALDLDPRNGRSYERRIRRSQRSEGRGNPPLVASRY